MLARAAAELPNSEIGFYMDMEDRLFSHFAPIVVKGQSTAMDKVPRDIVNSAKADAFTIVTHLKEINRELSKSYEGAEESPAGQAVSSAKETLVKMIGDLNNVFGENLMPEHADNWLSFIEIANSAKQGAYAVLHIKPIEIAPLMRGMLLDKIKPCVFLSATMKVNGSFTFMKKELGLPYDKTHEFTGESSFNYADNVVVYAPRDLPVNDGRESEPEYISSLAEQCIDIINKMQGKTMILFTNVTHMKKVFNIIQTNIKYPLYIQGQMSKNALLDNFKRDVSSCLLATKSFFTGVDVPGEALSCVVLIKCPFRIPSEPIFAARCEKIKLAGGNDFSDYALPLMLFDVRQAFGRLIRTHTDSGLFCFLDSRAISKSYWRNIRASLPEGMRYIQNLEKYK